MLVFPKSRQKKKERIIMQTKKCFLLIVSNSTKVYHEKQKKIKPRRHEDTKGLSIEHNRFVTSWLRG